jgi:hypothetical protein
VQGWRSLHPLPPVPVEALSREARPRGGEACPRAAVGTVWTFEALAQIAL